MSNFVAKPAKREPFFPSILLSGLSGSGKTYSALLLAQGIGGKVVVVDTENKRALQYAPFFKFEHIDFPAPFTPERAIEAMKAALSYSPNVVIVDSATHEWWGRGGILREKDEMLGSNDYIKWGKLTPRHEKYVGMLTMNPKCFYIVTVRGKEKNKLKKDSEGKLQVVPQGVQPVQRADFAYDFTLGYTLAHGSHKPSIIKTVEGAPLCDGVLDAAFGASISEWALMKKASKAKK